MKSRGEWRQFIKYRRPVAFFHAWSPRQLLCRPRRIRTSQAHGGGAYIENHMPYFPLGNITRETFSLFTSFTLRILYICYSFSVWDQLVTSMYILEYKISLKAIHLCHSFVSAILFRPWFKVLLYHEYINANNGGNTNWEYSFLHSTIIEAISKDFDVLRELPEDGPTSEFISYKRKKKTCLLGDFPPTLARQYKQKGHKPSPPPNL